MKSIKYFLILLVFALMTPQPAHAQRKRKKTNPPQIAAEYHSSLSYRQIGPFRGGRSAAVTGVPGKPNLFYFGATGGGVWKTENG
ncbi:MAG: hypothetical protein VW972_04680, partial [Flavobacteriaceae bacterium]